MTNNPKPLNNKRRFVQVNISPELDEMLHRWKESTGQSYADTLRQAAFEYLFPRQKMIAPRPPTELREVAAPSVAPPAPRQIRREIVAACARVLDPYLDSVPSLLESKEAGQRLEAILEGRRSDFEALGMDATGKSLLSILDTEAGLDPRLHVTADRILNPIGLERNGGAGPAATVLSNDAQLGPTRNRAQEAIIADYRAWLESKRGSLSGPELSIAFNAEVKARQQDIATAFKLAPFGNSGSPIPALSKAIIERIKSSEETRDDPRLQAMLNDLASPVLTKRKP